MLREGRNWKALLKDKGFISTGKIGKRPGRLSGIRKAGMIDDKLLSLCQMLLRGQGKVSSLSHPRLCSVSICQATARAREMLQGGQTSQGSLNSAGGAHSGRDAFYKDS